MSQQSDLWEKRVRDLGYNVNHCPVDMVPGLLSYAQARYEHAIEQEKQDKNLGLMIETVAELATQSGKVKYEGALSMVLGIVRMVRVQERARKELP